MGRPKQKDPFVNYSTEQIFASESILYVIYIGPDVFAIKGQWFFVKKAATAHYNKIVKQITKEIYEGNPKQQKRAYKLLGTVKIVPLRMH